MASQESFTIGGKDYDCFRRLLFTDRVQLAQAGFYYHPTSSCPDNVTCYLCRSNLDGWEETDDPIEEHMSHSGDCGWAITVFAERAVEHGHRDLADPLSAGMLEARRMTFTPGWPHENKRGWLCKKEKVHFLGYSCLMALIRVR